MENQHTFSLEAEQAVIGGLMIANNKWAEVKALVGASDFMRTDHQVLFGAMEALLEQEKPADAITLIDYLESRGELIRAGGQPYLASLFSGTGSAANVGAYASIVRKKAQARHVLAVAAQMQEAVHSGTAPTEAIANGMAALEGVTASKQSQYLNFAQLLGKGVDAIEAANMRKHETGSAGLPYGLPDVDVKTGGMHKGQLIVVAARPSLGKTALSHQVAMHNAKRGTAVGEISIEMSDEQLAIRSMAHIYRLNNTALKAGDDNTVSQLAPKMAMNSVTGWPLYTDTTIENLSEIESRLIEWRHRYGIELAIVDHIGLIHANGFGNRNDMLGHVTRRLKKLAKSLDIPIIMVSQFSRGVEKEKRRPVLSDLRDSGNIEQDVDIALFIHHEDESSEHESHKLVELGLLKNRDGFKGWLSETFAFEGSTMTFKQMSETYDEEFAA